MASLQFANNYAVTELQKKAGTARPADADKLNTDLRSLATDMAEADGSVTGQQTPNGNMRGTRIQVTTPATAGTVIVVKHGLSYAPMNVRSSCPLIAGGQQVTVAYGGTPSDKQQIWVKFPVVADQSVTTSLVIW